MPTLAWSTPAAAPRASQESLVMASSFQLTSLWDVPLFFVAALRIRRQMLASPGVIGVSLIAHPLRKTFYTLSAWQDRHALDTAVATQPHVTTMARFRPKMASSVFTFWTISDGRPPQWPDARRRLEEAAV